MWVSVFLIGIACQALWTPVAVTGACEKECSPEFGGSCGCSSATNRERKAEGGDREDVNEARQFKVRI